MSGPAIGFRLSPSQRRWWHLGAVDGPFRVQCALTLAAGSDAGRLRQSLADAVAREPIFGTRFHRVPGLTAPIQAIDRPGVLAWRDVELDDSPIDPERLLASERETSIDFEDGPLVRALCAKGRDGTETLVISAPSLCADAATLAMLVGDMAGRPRNDGVPFVQFAEWQNLCAESGAALDAVARWTALESQASANVRIAGERRSPASGFSPRFQSTTLPPTIVERIRATAARAGVSPDAWVLACWQHVLRTLTGSEDVVLGVIAPGRDHPSVAGVCGPVNGPIPHQPRVAADAPFVELARSVEAALAEARESGPYYAAADTTAFPFTFSCETWPPAGGDDRRLTLVARHVCVERFLVHVTMAWVGDGLVLDLGRDTARISDEAAVRVGAILRSLLHETLERPDRPTDALDLLTEESRRTILDLSQGPSAPVPEGSLVQRFERQVAAAPDRLAVVSERRALTARGLNAAANRVARALRRVGAGPDARIGLVVDRTADTMVGLLGILKAGAAYVPIDHADPVERWRACAADAGIAALVVQAPLTPPADLGVPVVRLPLDPEASQTAEVAANAAEGHDLAYAIFTSGSTGRPKGVAIEHRSVVNLLAALERGIYRPLGGPLRIAVNAPLTFDASVKQWIQILHGHTLCIVPGEVRSDPVAMIAWLDDLQVDVFDCTPAQLRTLMAAGLSDAAVPGLEAVLVGGEAIDVALWNQLSASETRIRFFDVYGPTECTVDATACLAQPALDVPVIGRPLAGVQTYVLDRRLQPVPAGVPGELFVGGAGVARGYMNAPALTAERFVPNPFDVTGGARLYRTGDRAWWLDNGHLEFLGRLDRQVKVRGNRIEPGEIEAALARHPAVRAAVVRTDTTPEGLARLSAYVVVPTGTTLKESELRTALRRTLPEFMMPDRIARIDRLPLTAHGKVDLGALAALARPLDRDVAVLPRNDLERTIAEVWRDVLEIEAVGIDDNFFDVGGHSLLLARLYSRLRERLGREFAMVDLFQRPTISSFASFLAAGAEQAWSPAAAVARADRQKQAYRRQQSLRSKEP